MRGRTKCDCCAKEQVKVLYRGYVRSYVSNRQFQFTLCKEGLNNPRMILKAIQRARKHNEKIKKRWSPSSNQYFLGGKFA